MKTAMFALALLFPFSALADNPFYLGLSAGVATIDKSKLGLAGAGFDDKAGSGQAYLGWQLRRFIAVELSYTYVADLESDEFLRRGADAQSTFQQDSIGLGLVLTPGVGTIETKASKGGIQLRPFATAGWHKWDVEEKIEISSTTEDDEEDYDGDDIYYGLGMDIKATDGLFFRLEWRRMQFDAPNDAAVNMLWFGLREDFGWK